MKLSWSSIFGAAAGAAGAGVGAGAVCAGVGAGVEGFWAKPVVARARTTGRAIFIVAENISEQYTQTHRA
jgi:hypothetical protein